MKLVVAGNILIVLWVTFNAIDSGFKGTLPEIVSYIFLMLLLGLNSYLLMKK